MPEVKAPDAIRSGVTITNNASGPRFVHTTEGPRTIGRGETATGLIMREVEITALPEGVVVGEGSAEADMDTGGDESGEFALTDIPDDLQSDRSGDGIVGRDKLLDVAKAEGVEVESDDNKLELLRKIVAKRASTPTDAPTE